MSDRCALGRLHGIGSLRARLGDWRARVAIAVVAAAIAGCATTPPADSVQPDVDDEPMATPAPQPMVEYPPIEPVEPPEAVEPTPEPPPVVISPPATPPPAPQSPPPHVAMATPSPAPVLAAPTPAPTPTPTPEPTPEEKEMNALLADLNRYSVLPPDDVKKEIGTATLALSKQRTDHNRIRLAVLYTLARTPADDQRALQLFDNVLKGSSANGGAVKALAAVLQVQVAERVRAVRDEQRKGEVAVQKLEALRDMERSLLRDRIRNGGGGGGGSAGGGGGSAGGSGGGGAGGR